MDGVITREQFWALAKFKYPTHQISFCSEKALKSIEKIYNLADMYHSDNLNRVCEDFIEKAEIKDGTFDNVSAARYAIPSHWDMGKVYKRLILGIAREKEIPVVDALFEAYHSFVSEKIDDYNSSFYYDAPQNILNAFLDGKIR